MRYNLRDPGQAGDWRLYETVKNGHFLCTEEFSDVDEEEILAVYGKLRILQAAGFPTDPEKGSLRTQVVGRHHCRRLGNVTVHVLKVKPGPWRLYFFVSDGVKKEIEFLTSSQKKQQRRDPRDFERCCKILNDIDNGRTTRTRIEIPDR